MHVQQFFLSCLAQASYVIGSDGEAVVVDPQRDVDLYINEAREHGFAIKYVIETHLHADFVSGHHELAKRTGAQMYVGAKANAAFAHVDVRDGDEIRIGRVRLRFLETPGHTLESISIVVIDEEQSRDPYAVLTGDTLFIGDVGRPDLGGEPRELAGLLYEGSLCGRARSEDRSSTIGRERRTNYALQAASKDEFIELLTAELPERPKYFARDVELNRAGAGSLADLAPVRAMSVSDVVAAQQRGAVVLDVRDEDAFGAGHVRDAVNIGLGGQFASWAGTSDE